MTNLSQIKFGTDGWRAVIARDYTFANLERVAQAYADYLNSSRTESLVKQLVDVGQISTDEAQIDVFFRRSSQSVPLKF